MIELGGNIALDGFAGRDYAELIVVKKIVGRYARQISDAHAGFERLQVTLATPSKGSFSIAAECVIGTKRSAADATAQNLFIALDSALKGLVAEL